MKQTWILAGLSSGLIGLALALVLAAPRGAAPSGVARLAPEGEPGVRLHVVGQVQAPDGAPVEGATLTLWQTDARGLYREPGEPTDVNRLSAEVATGGEGRFELLTIRPASYPGSSIAQHIHYVVRTADGDRTVGEILFADDPLFGEAERAAIRRGAATLCVPTPAASGVRCEVVIRG